MADQAGARKAWGLTPKGRERVQELVGDLNLAELQPELVYAPGVEFGHALHTLLPPSLAPVKWAAAIKRLLERFPFEQNVFCMTRFPDDDEDTAYLDPVKDVITAARDALGRHGLTLHLASDRQIDDDLLANIAGYMWACKYGIGLFEDRLGRDLNKNLVIEVGSMLMTGRRCALLKDRTAPPMPTDFIGQIYKPVDFDDLAGLADALHLWAPRTWDSDDAPRVRVTRSACPLGVPARAAGRRRCGPHRRARRSG